VAVRLKPDFALAHNNLGAILRDRGQLDEAIAEHREATRLKNDYAIAHSNLGVDLREKGQLDEAIAECREAIRLKANSATAHGNLGNALAVKGQLDEALAEHREALRLEDSAGNHLNLGNTLSDKGDVDGAIAEYRKAIAIQPSFATGHYNLGNHLHGQGKLVEAEAAYRSAIAVEPGLATAHCNLGHLLRDKGQFAEALSYLRRGHELGSKNPRWPYPSAQWVKRCERLAELDAKLPRMLMGELQPADARERLALAQLCQMSHKLLYAAAARLYADAFAEQSNLADNLQGQHRYNAACAAVLAGCGQGKDADQTDGKERARLRRQSLEWLRADLTAYRKLLDKEPDKAAPLVRQQMLHWQQDTDLAGVRGAEALAKLPEAERQDWQKLWADVAELLARARDKAVTEKKSSQN
jgi:Tfp pilus assembly protein PilF